MGDKKGENPNEIEREMYEVVAFGPSAQPGWVARFGQVGADGSLKDPYDFPVVCWALVKWKYGLWDAKRRDWIAIWHEITKPSGIMVADGVLEIPDESERFWGFLMET